MSFLLKRIKIKIKTYYSDFICKPFLIKRYKEKYNYYHNDVILFEVKDLHGWYDANKLLELSFEGHIKGGDWLNKIISREEMLKKSPKYRAICQRYNENMPWSDTDLFKKRYAKILSNGNKVKGYNRLLDLEKHYELTYDSLFLNLKKSGFKSPDDSKDIATIYIYIYKNGEILYTRDGCHRLFMAMVLGIEKIPVKVWTRHKEWQKKKEKLLNNNGEVRGELKKYLDHPDIKPYL